MKVMCIKVGLNWKLLKFIFGINHPDVLDECTVTDTHRCPCGKHDVYELEGYNGAYETNSFATLPDRDADEINAEVRESIVNIETN
jgi:hypothetical protein